MVVEQGERALLQLCQRRQETEGGERETELHEALEVAGDGRRKWIHGPGEVCSFFFYYSNCEYLYTALQTMQIARGDGYTALADFSFLH